MKLINKESNISGIHRARLLEDDRVYIAGYNNNDPYTKTGEVDEDYVKNNTTCFPKALWCAPCEAMTHCELPASCWVTFEIGDGTSPVIIGFQGDSIKPGNFGSGGSGGYSGSSGSYAYSKYIIVGDSRVSNITVKVYSEDISKIPNDEVYICLGGQGRLDWILRPQSESYESGVGSGFDKDKKTQAGYHWDVIQSITDSIESGAVLIIASCGINDEATSKSTAFTNGASGDYNIKLLELIEKFKDKNIDIWFMSIGKLSNNASSSQQHNVDKFNKQLKEFCSKHPELKYFDTDAALTDPIFEPDMGHYNPEGARKFHDVIKRMDSRTIS